MPITSDQDVTKNIPVCHSKIRAFEWSIEFVTRLLSHQKWSTQTKPVRYTEEEKQSYKDARQKLKEDLYHGVALNIGNAGDMVTGPAFKNFSSDTSRNFIVTLVPEDVREAVGQILLGLCAAVKVINSQTTKLNIDKMRLLTQDVNKKIVETFPWAVISPSVHRILGHAWEVIQQNDSFGLGGLGEEGLEALNKNIRETRNHGARKISTEENMTDSFNHLWDRSRPTIAEMERVIKRRPAKLVIAREIEALVESLFLEETESQEDSNTQ